MSRGAFVGAVFVSVLLTLGMVYYVVPIFYSPPGTIIQTKDVTNSDFDVCWATNMTWFAINGSSTTLTTKGGSHLQVSYECPFTLQYESSLAAGTIFRFEVSLAVAGVKATNFTIYYALSAASTAYGQVPVPVTLTLITPTLPAGTYSIAINWVSQNSVATNNCLKTGLNAGTPFPHSLIAQEISG